MNTCLDESPDPARIALEKPDRHDLGRVVEPVAVEERDAVARREPGRRRLEARLGMGRDPPAGGQYGVGVEPRRNRLAAVERCLQRRNAGSEVSGEVP